MNKKNDLVTLAPDLGNVGELPAEDFAVQNSTPARRKRPADKGKSPITGKGLPRPTRVPTK